MAFQLVAFLLWFFDYGFIWCLHFLLWFYSMFIVLGFVVLFGFCWYFLGF